MSTARKTLCALPALWTGLLYDHTSLGAAEALVADWTLGEIESLRRDVPRLGLGVPFRGGKVLDVAREVVGGIGTGGNDGMNASWKCDRRSDGI